jgi:flavin-dependent dehydrogenase
MSAMVGHVVIGGGPAGSMLAVNLALAGREVILLEKQHKPHDKICGEFLSAEAIRYLQRIGIDLRALGAHAIHSIRLQSGRKSAQASLPFPALSLSRRILDETLLEKASSAGCEIRRGSFVQKISKNSGGFSIQLRDGQAIQANSVFLATGKHDLAELPREKGSHSDLVGFKMHWQLTAPPLKAISHMMELFLFRDGYGGLALIENNIANLCFVLRQRQVRTLGGWHEILSAVRNEVPAIAQILNGATQCWPKPLAISPIPYGYVAKSSGGIWRLGDQAAVIPSFTGDGMSIALHTAELASRMFLSGKTPDEYLDCLQTQLHFGMHFATTLSRIMVTSTGRLLAPAFLSLVPGAIGWIANQTRIPARVLQATDLARSTPGDHLPASTG